MGSCTDPIGERDCPDCARADVNPPSPLYRTGCSECSARMLSHGLEHAKSMAALRMTEGYVSQLRAAFGADWEAGHQRVKHWARRIAEARMGVDRGGPAKAAPRVVVE